MTEQHDFSTLDPNVAAKLEGFFAEGLVRNMFKKIFYTIWLWLIVFHGKYSSIDIRHFAFFFFFYSAPNVILMKKPLTSCVIYLPMMRWTL